ncbi:MAG: 3-deoxy-manno-octulosonate cytidylyltransferase [Kiritimatiellaeota bacterium]|nr:3-deoxy-manno-octulosonate cytidylyltransferase [Kiritimatiellota bacterium]
MKTIGVIPSRWGSTRFPGKSLHHICGKPLVKWVVEACLRAKTLDEVVVATDDERIRDALMAGGAVSPKPPFRVAMTRSDHPSGTDRVAEAANASADDIIINIQGDEPLIDPALIDRVAAKLKDETMWVMSTACAPIRTAEELNASTVVKVVLDSMGGALYFSRYAIPFKRDGVPDPATGFWKRHIGIYAYRGEFLRRLVATPPCALEQTESLEQLRAMWLGGRIGVVETDEIGIGVDRPEDVAAVEAIIKSKT